MANVHVAITRRVLPGLEGQFETQLARFMQDSMAEAGITGVHVLKPPAGSSSREYGILRSFDNAAAAEAFYQSRRFHQWLEDVEPLVEGEPLRRQLTGLEAFFRFGGHGMPPKWKMAVVTWLGVVPSVLVWTTVLPPVLTHVHWLVQAAIINACVVATLAWGVMPLLTRGLDRWLHPPVTNNVPHSLRNNAR